MSARMQEAVLFLEPNYRWGHPEIYLFSLSKKNNFLDQSIQKNVSFNFEKGSTGKKVPLSLLLFSQYIEALPGYDVPVNVIFLRWTEWTMHRLKRNHWPVWQFLTLERRVAVGDLKFQNWIKLLLDTWILRIFLYTVKINIFGGESPDISAKIY